MKKLLAVLFILLVPSLSSGSEEIDLKDVTPPVVQRDATLPDVFFYLAHTCQTFAVDCLPDNLVSNPFVAYIKFFVPSTQPYTRHYIVTDTEGAIVGYTGSSSALTGPGNQDRFNPISLTSGKVYRFIAIVVGETDGKSAVSDPYTFRVVP